MKDTDDENTWVAKMTWNDKEKKLSFDETFASSMYIRGADVRVLCEIDETKVLLQLDESILVVDKWKVVNKIDVSCDFTI